MGFLIISRASRISIPPFSGDQPSEISTGNELILSVESLYLSPAGMGKKKSTKNKNRKKKTATSASKRSPSETGLGPFYYVVHGGETIEVQVPKGDHRHLSFAMFGPDKEIICHQDVLLYVTVDDKKLLVGRLHPNGRFRENFNLMFDRSFTLSHSSEASVIFSAFKSDQTAFTLAYPFLKHNFLPT